MLSIYGMVLELLEENCSAGIPELDLRSALRIMTPAIQNIRISEGEPRPSSTWKMNPF